MQGWWFTMTPNPSMTFHFFSELWTKSRAASALIIRLVKWAQTGIKQIQVSDVFHGFTRCCSLPFAMSLLDSRYKVTAAGYRWTHQICAFTSNKSYSSWIQIIHTMPRTFCAFTSSLARISWVSAPNSQTQGTQASRPSNTLCDINWWVVARLPLRVICRALLFFFLKKVTSPASPPVHSQIFTKFSALSSTKAEYPSTARAAQESTWLKQLMEDLHQPTDYQARIFCDNYPLYV